MRKKYPPKKDSEENREKAFNKSLKYLSFRTRSVKEIYDYLIRKNFAQDSINAVLKRLIDLKFLDDEEFGRQWIESRQKHKGKSKFVLKNELKLKGLSDDLIEPLLKEAQEDLKTAQNLFERKKEKMKELSSEEFKKRITGFLQRKGYAFEIIGRLLKEA